MNYRALPIVMEDKIKLTPAGVSLSPDQVAQVIECWKRLKARPQKNN